MDTNWYGVAVLLGLGLSVPVWRKVSHTRALKSLDLDGVTVVPNLWGLSGLRIVRPSRSGAVSFETGGPRGHVVLAALLQRPTPSLTFDAGPATAEDAVTTGDAEFDQKFVVRGDREYGAKLLGSEMRERLKALDRLGGRIGSLGGGTLVIAGPLLTRPAELKEFLKSCEAVIDRTVACDA